MSLDLNLRLGHVGAGAAARSILVVQHLEPSVLMWELHQIGAQY